MGDCGMPECQAGIQTPIRLDPPGFSVRLAVRAELDEIAALFAPGLERYRGGGGDRILDAYLLDLLDVRSRFDVAETYVAVRNERIVGSVAFYPDVILEGWSNLPAGWAGFRALVVDPHVRGAGIGRALVDRCLGLGGGGGHAILLASGPHTRGAARPCRRLFRQSRAGSF